MSRRFPLFAKILCWGLLNIALLIGAVWLLLAQQLRLGLDSLLAGGAGDRLRSLGNLVVRELNDSEPAQWDGILEKFGGAYPVGFHLISHEGSQIAGPPVTIPQELAERLGKIRTPRFPPPGGPNRPRNGEGPPENDARFQPEDRPPGAPPMRDGPPPRHGSPNQNPPPPIDDAGEILGVVRTSNPNRYWVLLRAPLQRRMPGMPAALVLESKTLGASGLIFDFRPVFWIGAGALVLSALFWLPLIRSITRSIAAMRDATVSISQGKFDARVNDRRRDELGALGEAVNHMSERLAGLLNGQRRFLSDVAHELCAPLSRLQVALSILESRATAADQGRLADLREEVDHMAGLVNELLSFSRAALGARSIHRRAFAVEEVIEKVVRRESIDGAQIEVECREIPSALGDPDLIQRALGNLLRNALRYAGRSGPILVTAQAQGAEIRLEVADVGPGVPEQFLPQLFDPFFRVDASRTRDTGGVGLGLTIARTCVEASGGRITLANRQPAGFCAAIYLPRVADVAASGLRNRENVSAG